MTLNNSSLLAGGLLRPRPVFFGKPCARCRKRWTCWDVCHELELYLMVVPK
jgi:hypothetical protein